MIRRAIRRLASRFGLAFTSDRAFVEAAYREILGRDADPDGLRYYTERLRDGHSRAAVLMGLVRSEEFTDKLAPMAVADIRRLRPESYRLDEDVLNKTPILVFEARAAGDFDWLESMLLEHRYYERPGVWSLQVDVDKRVMAELLSAFQPENALELGCASGAVLQCLDELGIRASGVEISGMAIARAAPAVREHIRQGDLLGLDLDGGYDLVYGLDVFEHLNPNRLDLYLARAFALAREGAFLFCNVPAFGADPAFGTVFPFYVAGWIQDAARGRPFSRIHCDEQGFPLHGHLVWADSHFWTSRFEAQGFRREHAVEKALHDKYDAYMVRWAPARRTYYVFSKSATGDRSREIVARIGANPSKVLADERL